jgi:hypothetical protein
MSETGETVGLIIKVDIRECPLVVIVALVVIVGWGRGVGRV